MSNKNLLLLLPNYYVQSSINYIINITENIYTVSIAEWFHVCGSSGAQNPGPVKSYTLLYSIAMVRHHFNIYAITLVCIAVAL